jgi:SPP1 family predicted phage head-tail adaptor
LPDRNLFDNLDRKITLQQRTVAQDDTGQEIETWSDLVTIAASWRRASARETLASAEVQATASDVFVIRYSAKVASSDPSNRRLVYEGRTYDISEVTEIGRREGLRIGALVRTD